MGATILPRISRYLIDRRLDRILAEIPTADRATNRGIAPILRRWARKTLLAADQASAHSRFQTSDPKVPSPPPGLISARRPKAFTENDIDLGSVCPRPETFLSEDMILFHDCSEAAITIRQIPNRGPSRISEYGLQLETFAFSGTFFTIKVLLPFETPIDENQILSFRAFVETNENISLHARLCIAKGAHTEEIIRDIPIGDPLATAEFDLHFIQTRLDGSQEAWIDISFSNISWSKLTIRDMILMQSKRAEA